MALSLRPLAAGLAMGTFTEPGWAGSNTAQVGMGTHGQRCPPQFLTDRPGALARVSQSGLRGQAAPGLHPPRAADRPEPDARSSDVSC